MKKYIAFLSCFLLLSCSVSKRKYLPGYHIARHGKKVNLPDKKTPPNKIEARQNITSVEIKPSDPLLMASSDNSTIANEWLTKKKKTIFDEPCDVLVMKDGSEIKVHLIEISPRELKYKSCDNPDGPNYVVEKSKVFMVKYANGTKEVFKTENTSTVPNNTGSNQNPMPYMAARTSGMAIASLVLGILGFYPLVFIGGLLALIFGIIGLNQINKEPNVYKGKGMAITGISLGAASLILWTVVLIFAFI